MKGLAKFKPGQGMGSIDNILPDEPKPQSHEKTGAFITHANYPDGPQTDVRRMSNNATDMSTHMGMMDPVAQHRKMSHEELMNERNRAHSEAEPAE